MSKVIIETDYNEPEVLYTPPDVEVILINWDELSEDVYNQETAREAIRKMQDLLLKLQEVPDFGQPEPEEYVPPKSAKERIEAQLREHIEDFKQEYLDTSDEERDIFPRARRRVS